MAESTSIALTKVTGSDILCLTVTWQAAANGGLTSTAITANQAKVLAGMYAIQAVVNPGATAPTAAYDVYLNDADGVDVFGAALENLSATVSSTVRPAIATLAGKRLVSGILTFALSGNSVDSANGVVKFYFSKN